MTDKWTVTLVFGLALIFFGAICTLDYIDTYTKISMAKNGYEQTIVMGSSHPRWQKVR